MDGKAGGGNKHFLLFFFFQFNFTHTINWLSFGEDYPGQVNPLDKHTDVATEDLTTGMNCIRIVMKQCHAVW